MQQTIDIKDPVICSKCNNYDCQTTWIITDNKVKEEIITRDCDIESYKKLPKWIDTSDYKSNNKYKRVH